MTPATVGTPVLLIALGAVFVSLAIIVASVLGLLTRAQRPEERIRRRLSVYSVTGRQPLRTHTQEQSTVLGGSAVARSAVELAGRVVQRRDLDTAIGARLEAAGLPLRTPEWMLLHIGVAVGAGLLFLLLGRGRLGPTLIGLVVGLVGPWMYLTIRQDRRQSAFLGQLPDTLQMLAGSLSAGYSMPQALDTVVREGHPPMSTEFNRALIESRLGVPVEDALEGIAERLDSKDFSWVVMAVRIQREVGGNLAELLSTVSETLRERERLRRQVRVLSAEGRLSGWVLGLLPVVFGLYLFMVKPEYLAPLWTRALGIVMLVAAAVLMSVGTLWMIKAVKVEV